MSSLPDQLDKQIDDSVKSGFKQLLDQIESELIRNCKPVPRILKQNLGFIFSCNFRQHAAGEAGKALRGSWKWLDIADALRFVSNELPPTITAVEEECTLQLAGLLEKHKNRNSAFDGEFRLVGLHSIVADACPRWPQLRLSLTELLQRLKRVCRQSLHAFPMCRGRVLWTIFLP